MWQTEVLGLNNEQVAHNLGVDKSTVSRIRQRFLTTGNLKKNTYPKERAYRKLTSPAQLLVLHLVIQKPGIYFHEVQKDVMDTLQLEVDISTICRFLKESGFTRQKLCYVALQRDDYLRQKFTWDMSLYDPSMFIFLDETGTDRRDVPRKYGYSMRGKPAHRHTLLVRGEHVSGIAVISVNGLLDISVVKGSVDGDKFYSFVLKHLLPHHSTG